MSKKCTCFDDHLNAIKKRVEEQLPEGAIDLHVSWEGYSFFFAGDYSPVNPRINIEYRRAKKGGGHAKNLTKNQTAMLCQYCPFCGRELAGSGEKAA